MSSTMDWTEVALRLALTSVAALALGFNRTERGKAAGMRTIMLVCLAASVAMIQVNLLLPTAGRQPDSFVMNDLMRLPLGILTGVGFIGGGVIFRRDDIVTGVTTAATLWLATVIGLCFGGGQIGLGLAATALGLAALWPLAWFERRLPRERIFTVTIELGENAPSEDDIRRKVLAAGLAISGSRISMSGAESTAGRKQSLELIYRVRCVQASSETAPPPLLGMLAGEHGITKLEWRDSAAA